MPTDSARALELIDGDLVQSYLEGQAPSFDLLYRRHFPRLTGLLRRITGDPMLAEDLAQETLVRALTHLDGFDLGRPMWPWLKTIATRLAIDHARSRDRETVAEPEDGEDPASRDDAWPEERLVLLQALESVPRRQRVALMLRYLDDWTPAEVAGFLGLSRPAFEQLLFRARRTLRTEYRRLSGGALGLILLPLGWARRHVRALGARLHQAGGGSEWIGSVTAMQLASGLLAIAVGLTGPAVAPSARPRIAAAPAPAALAPAVVPPAARVPGPGGAALTAPPAAAAAAAAPARRLVGDVTDPNAGVDEPEDVRIDSMIMSPGFKRDGSIFASGATDCRLPPCPPVLFRSRDGGATWTRLPAWGFSGSAVLLPPAFGQGDPRIFAMGPEGLQMSLDEGDAFVPAVIGGMPYAVGAAAISPAFDAGDPTILIGAQTLLRYEAEQGTIQPAPYTALPGPLEPAFAPAYPLDSRLVLGAVRPDGGTGALVSTVYVCSATVCSETSLPGEQEVPRVRLDRHFGRTGIAYAFTSRAVYASTDGARSFVPLRSGWSSGVGVRDIAVDGLDVIATTLDLEGAGGGGVFRSADGGRTWVRATWKGFAGGAGAIARMGDRIVVTLGRAGLACSADAGVSWARRCA